MSVRSKCSSLRSSKVVGVLLEGGVVDQDVELAELPSRSWPTASSQNSAIGDVAGDQDAAAPFLLDRALGFLGVLVLVEIDDRDIGAFAREQHRHRAADAGIAAGDDAPPCP